MKDFLKIILIPLNLCATIAGILFWINKLNNVENYFYLINYCKLLDRLARCLCETRDFEKAATYLRNSINLLIFIYNDEFNISVFFDKLQIEVNIFVDMNAQMNKTEW